MTATLTDLQRIALAHAGDHSIFAPSASAMWMNCSGSLLANVVAPDDAGYEAAEGTVAHSVGEEWLRTGVRPLRLLGTVVPVQERTEMFHIPVDLAMLDQVQRYVDWCYGLPGDHFVETRVDFSDLTPIPKQGGTADHAVCQPGVLIITDLKYGKGEQVFAEKNTQALLYAYGFFREWDWFYDFKTIHIRICQPRLDHFDTWLVTRDELLAFADYAKARAAAAWEPDAPRTPGEKQCRWCRVRVDCVARAAYLEKLIDDVFDDLSGGDPETVTHDEMVAFAHRLDDEEFEWRMVDITSLTVKQKAKLVTHRKMVEKFFSDIYEELESRILRGEDVPDHKVVDGRSFRSFINTPAAIEHLEFIGVPKEKICPATLISPAVAEEEIRALGFKRKDIPGMLASVVVKPKGSPTMVHVSDKRKAITIGDDDVFGNDTSDDL